jgi:D-3-phosphoglycerate dehydrogenase
MKVLVTEPVSEQGLSILAEAGQVDVRLGLNGAALAEAIGEYSVLVVRSATRVTADIIDCAANLKMIGRCGVGVDNIDVDAATRRGILVVNSPTGNTLAAAELTVSMLFALARNLPDAVASLRGGKWERKKFLGVELHDKTLGVVGFGKIGSEVARRALGLDMRVLAFDPQINLALARNMGVEVREDLDALLAESDFITFHLPLNKHTQNLLNADRLKLLKPNARIINCARGGIIDEVALAEALREGRVAGAAVDVWEHEPPLDDHRSPLLDAPNVLPTPHLGASTTEAQENVAIDVAQQVLAAMRGEPVQGAVNLPQLEAEEHRRLRPYLLLGEQLGKFLAQLSEGDRILSVEIGYLGRLQHEPTAPLTRAVLRGLLRAYIDDQSINYINVPSVVADQGIQVTETKSSEASSYSAVLRLKLVTEQHTHSADGACFGEDPRVVALDGYNFNIPPYGHLLVWWNLDHPGVIGKVGTLLGDAGVNIAGMQLGRDAYGGRAVSIVSVDAPVATEVLDRLRALPDLVDVRQVDFGNGDSATLPGLPLPVITEAGRDT